MARSRGAGRAGKDELSLFQLLAFRAAGSAPPPPAHSRRPPAPAAGRLRGRWEKLPRMRRSPALTVPLGDFDRGLRGGLQSPGSRAAAATHALEFLRVGAGPGAGRGSRVLGHGACGGWLSARGDTHTHTHTPPRGATAGGGEYWFRYRGHAAPRPRARAGAPTLTKHTCLGTGDKAVLRNATAVAPPCAQAFVGRGTEPQGQSQEGNQQSHAGSPQTPAQVAAGGKSGSRSGSFSASVPDDQRGWSGEILKPRGGGGPVIPAITSVGSGRRPGDGGWGVLILGGSRAPHTAHFGTK